MDWLRIAAEGRPDAPALITPDDTVTFGELDRAADVVASIVVGSGLEGEAVAFWGERNPATVAALWGIPRAGSTAVPVDSRWPPADAMRLTRAAGVRGLWAVPEGGIRRLLDRSPSSPSHHGPPDPASRFVIFTSGSEGPPKGVILTGTQLDAATEASQERLGNGPDDPWLCVLPLFHVGGLSILWRQARAGAPTTLLPTFDPGAASRALDGGGFASLVPTMLRRMLAAGARGSERLGGVLIGGGPADTTLLDQALEAGIPALQTYGMTEMASQVSTVAPGDERTDLGTAGRPLDGAQVRIAESGRIEVRGPMLSPGYLGEEPRDPDSWFTTGDLGRVDDAGRLVVLGRADAVIVTGGEKVNPAVVESALRAIGGVVDARVFGVADPEWGRKVVAEVVLDGITLDEVLASARNALRPHEVPREWRPVGSLPSKLDDR